MSTNFGDQHGENLSPKPVNREWLNRLKRFTKYEAVGELKGRCEKTIEWCDRQNENLYQN